MAGIASRTPNNEEKPSSTRRHKTHYGKKQRWNMANIFLSIEKPFFIRLSAVLVMLIRFELINQDT